MTGSMKAAQRVSRLMSDAPGEDRTRRRENTRMRLVRASVSVFVEKGIDAATVDDLVSAAGFTRGAFYSSFSTKEQLFTAAFEQATGEVIRIMQDSVAAHRDGEGPVTALDWDAEDSDSSQQDDAAVVMSLFSAIRPVGRDWCLMHAEALTLSLRSEQMRSQLSAQRARLRSTVTDALRDGIDGDLDHMAIPVDDLAQLLVSIFIDMYQREHLEGSVDMELATTIILGTLRAFVQPVVER
jgi:AcrR family transcriptional regulator